MAVDWTVHADTLRSLAAEGLTDTQIAAKIPGATYAAVHQARVQLGVPSGRAARSSHLATITRVVSETPERTVLAPEDTDAEPIEDLWDRAVIRTQRESIRHRKEGVARVQIMTNRPVAISISSDWHVSTSNACNLPGLRTYAETIRDTPGAYALAVGDMADNPIKWSKQMRDVPDEWRLVGHLFGTFGLKMLGVASGNHDDWTKAFAGVDQLKQLVQRERIHFAPDEITWIVELVDGEHRVTARYVIATRHKFRRHSNMNWTHACYRYLEDRVGQWPLGEDGGELIPDIIAIGDNHVAAVEERDMANKPIWAARMGPWQTGSTFGRALGFHSCPPTAPTFVLYPHRSKRIAGFADYNAALDLLRMERGSVPI